MITPLRQDCIMWKFYVHEQKLNIFTAEWTEITKCHGRHNIISSVRFEPPDPKVTVLVMTSDSITQDFIYPEAHSCPSYIDPSIEV